MEKKSKRVNTKFMEKEHFLIGKYTAINGPGAAVRRFKKSQFPFQIWRKPSKSTRQKLPGSREKVAKTSLETVDEKVCKFFQIVRGKGDVINSVVAIATANALIAKSGLEHLEALDLENSSWTKSLFRRMGFVRRAKTTSKPEIPERGKNEATLILHYQIIDLVEKYQIPSSILINIDQTPLKYAPVSNQTMA